MTQPTTSQTTAQYRKIQAQRAVASVYTASVARQCMSIDPRLDEYIYGIIQGAFTEAPTDPETTIDCSPMHNYYEILGVLRFLRLLRTYDFNAERVRFIIRLREGEWQCEEHHGRKMWRHVSGGLRCPGTSGPTVYRWQPFQVFILCCTFGFYAWMDTHKDPLEIDTLLPTERLSDDGLTIEDYRRLCTEFVFYGPRKTDKTGLSAFIQFVFFLFEDKNAEIYCCANASDQSKILYRRTRQLIEQMDQKGRFHITEKVIDWKPQCQSEHTSMIIPLSAGGKKKDGMYGQLCNGDEYGSSEYVNGHSDMQNLMDVVESSMGPRREPMTFITTTAGRIQAGPFKDKLTVIHQKLEREMEYYHGEASPQMVSDRALCLCLEPDEWERTEEVMMTSRDLWRKVNPMLGIIVQHSFYEKWVNDVHEDSTKLPEYVTKLMNVYYAGTVKDWLSEQDIAPIQRQGMRIEDCTEDDGWTIYVGMDFSLGDDLHAMSYLAYRYNEEEDRDEFFGDMDAWVTEYTFEHSPIRELYRQWIEQGWLHLSPGKTLAPELPVNRIIELLDQGLFVKMFLYDPYKARMPINALTSYLVSVGADPKASVIPCRQNFATFNPAVLEMDWMIKDGSHPLALSASPMWIYEAQNCVLQESTDGMGNRKPVKRAQDSKIDNIICLLEALIGFDIDDGKMQIE